ncbi:MAG: TraB/GumN family protein [Stappiaceae bacterium]
MIKVFTALSIQTVATMALIFLPPETTYAETFIPCQGKDMLEVMRSNEPDRYAGLIERSSRIPNSQGRFWRIEKSGVEPSFLFGTVHLADKDLSILPPILIETIKKSRLVYLETPDIGSQNADDAIKLVAQVGMLKGGKTLRGLMDRADYDKVSNHLAARGMQIELFNTMKPWLVAMTAMLPSCEIAMQIVKTPVVDARIGLLAHEVGTPLKGLETTAEQLSYFNEISIEDQIGMLTDLAKLTVDTINDSHRTMINMYQTGNIGLLWTSSIDIFQVDPNDPFLLFFEKRLLEDRNKIMFERSVEEVRKGDILVAVGAAHLIGETGLVAQYRDAGFTVTKILD